MNEVINFFKDFYDRTFFKKNKMLLFILAFKKGSVEDLKDTTHWFSMGLV